MRRFIKAPMSVKPHRSNSRHNSRKRPRRRLLAEQLEQRVVLAISFHDFSLGEEGFIGDCARNGNGGCRASGTPWIYADTHWQSVTTQDSMNFLVAPVLEANGDMVSFSFEHEYNFSDGNDGGAIQVSINGDTFVDIIPDGGYNGTNIFAFNRFGPGLDGWTGDSGGRVTYSASVETEPGDTFQFRLRSAFQSFFVNAPPPNWRVYTATIDTGGAAAAVASVVDRQLFYGGSFFDVDDAPGAANANDNAIATDKVALLPGETASFANYTSYSRGINGILVDIADLANEPTLETVGSFFEFSMGNDDTPDDWVAAPAPTDVVVRAGEGTDGSDRVSLHWDDNAIANSWLQVTVLANEETGLDAPDTFYFGNAVGDSGNSPGDAQVNAQDIGGPRDNPHNFLDRAPIDGSFDYNRDSLVNAQDIGLARDNPTNFLTAVNLITVPTAAPVGAGAAVEAVTEAADGLSIPLTDLTMSVDILTMPLQTTVPDGSATVPAGENVVSSVPMTVTPIDEPTRRIEVAEALGSTRDWSGHLVDDELLELLS